MVSQVSYPPYVSGIMHVLQDLTRLYDRRNGSLTENNQYKYLTTEEVQNLINKISPEAKELIMMHQPNELLQYHGNSRYSYPLGHQEVLLPAVEICFDSHFNTFNTFHYFKSLHLYLTKGEGDYHKELLDEANRVIEEGIEYKTSRLRKTVDKIHKLRKIKSDLKSGKTFEEGDFSFLHDHQMLSDHYQAMTKLGLKDFFKKPQESYMFNINSAPELSQFSSSKVLLDKNGNPVSVDDLYGHSGASFGFICRQMQTIMQEGWEQFVKSCMEYNLEELEQLEKYVVPLLECAGLM